MLMCIVGLGLGSSKNSGITNFDGTSSVTYALISVIFGVLCPISFAIGGLTVRYFSEKYNFDAFDMTITNYFLNNLILIIVMVFTYEYGSHPFIFQEYIEIVSAGVMAALGVVLLNIALTLGLAGPVFALTNIQVIIQSAMDAAIIGVMPTLFQIFSALFGILGAISFLFV